MTRGRKVLLGLFALCALVFVVSLAIIGHTLYERKQEADAFAALQAQAAAERQAAADAAAALAQGYDSLRAQNADYVGWLTVPDTPIDYPLMWTPSAPEYYLRRAFDQSASVSGTPFLGEGCDIDSDCLLIYGHDMDNGTMFGSLDRYADPAYLAAHPTLTIYTRTEVRQYQIFAAIQTRLPGANEEGFRYYDAAGPLDAAGFQTLTTWLVSNALYATDYTLAPEQQILILSTCSSHTENGRFLIAAQRIS